MADLKINQLDPIIPVSSGSGATYSALADGDMFIVKMKIRGTAIGDEDRKLTWLELRNSLNLGQYMPTVGGNFTGDVTLSNNKAIKSQQTGSGADISMLFVDNMNRLNLGSTTNLTRVQSSSVPQFIDGTGTYNFITSKNLPVPSDINAYTKAEVDNRDALKFDKTGGDVSGDINLTTNGSRLYGYTTDGTKVSLSYVTNTDTINFGHPTLHTNILSTDVPKWSNGTQSVDFITKSNLPVPNDINAYNKFEVDAKLSTKLNLTGGNMSGTIYFNSLTGIGFQPIPGTFKNGMTLDNNTIIVGDNTLPLRLWSSNNPVVRVGGSGAEYTIYHTGNKPSVAELGIDVLLNAKMDKLGGNFTGSVQFPNGQGIFSKTTSGATYSAFYSGDSETLFGDTVQPTVLRGSKLVYRNGADFDVYHTGNKPTAADVGSYTTSQADNAFARKGVNADITALNALTGALKVGANATQPLEVTTLQQVQALTSGTAGAVVGVVGGFIGAVMWFNGTRATIPAGWVPADGQLLNRADYPDLWAAVSGGALVSTTEALWLNSGDATYPANQRGKYSPGNGTTTFRSPDLNGSQSGSVKGLFLRGSAADNQAAVGVASPPGLPNITGYFRARGINSVNSGGTITQSDEKLFKSNYNSGPAVGQSANLPGGNIATDTFTFDASKVNAIYGDSSEVRPSNANGIWIIRASNSFAAANTNFAVYNGAGALPAVGSSTEGGLLQSIYNVAGVQDHSVNLSSRRVVGGYSAAVLTATSQAQSGVDAATSSMTFYSSGNLSVPGGVYVGGVTAFGSSPTGDISAKPSGNTWYAGSIRMSYTVMYPDGNSNPGIYVRDPVTSNEAYIATLTVKKERNRWKWDTSAGHFVNQSGQGSYASGYANAAYTAEAVPAPNNSSSYQPLIAMTGSTTNQGYRSAISFGKFTTGGAEMGYPIISRGLDDLDANGNGNRTANWTFGYDGSTGYGIRSNGGLIMPTGSDERIKSDIEEIDAQVSLENINKLKVKSYILKEDPNQRVTRGFIAQEAEAVDEKYVSKTPGVVDGKEVPDFRSLNTTVLLADAIAAIQVLTARIAELEAKAAE